MRRILLCVTYFAFFAACNTINVNNTNTGTNTNTNTGSQTNPSAPSPTPTTPTPPPTPTPMFPFGLTPSPTASYVASIRAALVAEGTSLAGPCGAFAITSTVAWGLSREDASYGLLDNESGTNCRGYAIDVVLRQDGTAFDVLLDAGGANIPQFIVVKAADPSRWRPAIQP